MSNELTIVLAIASVAALSGGALVAWRTRHGVTAPDPADEGRREVALIELRAVRELAQDMGEAEITGKRAPTLKLF